MSERRWEMFLLCTDGLDRDEGDRFLERVGIASRMSFHATEEEARAAAENALRKLKKVTDTEWAAGYVLPYEPGAGRPPSAPYPRIKILHSSELDVRPH